MSVDQASSAGAAAAPKGRWSEYTQLSRQIKQAGLLERRHGWYAAKIGLNLALLAAGWVAFVRPGRVVVAAGHGRLPGGGVHPARVRRP